jgi:hypothetical protein
VADLTGLLAMKHEDAASMSRENSELVLGMSSDPGDQVRVFLASGGAGHVK